MFEVSRSAGPVGFTAAGSAKLLGLVNLANLPASTNLEGLTKLAGLSRRSNLTRSSRLTGLSRPTGLSRRSKLGALAILSALAGWSNPSSFADWDGLAARARLLGRSRRTRRPPAALGSLGGGELRPRPEPGGRRTYLARAMYSRVSV